MVSAPEVQEAQYDQRHAQGVLSVLRGEVVAQNPGKNIVHTDPSDDKFIHCAINGNAEFIISGDDHLLSLRSVKNVRIVNPSEFMQLV